MPKAAPWRPPDSMYGRCLGASPAVAAGPGMLGLGRRNAAAVDAQSCARRRFCRDHADEVGAT